MRLSTVPLYIYAFALIALGFGPRLAFSADPPPSAKVRAECADSSLSELKKLRCGVIDVNLEKFSGSGGTPLDKVQKFCGYSIGKVKECCGGNATANCEDGFKKETKEDAAFLRGYSAYLNSGGTVDSKDKGLEKFCGMASDINSRGARVQNSLLGLCEVHAYICGSECSDALKSCRDDSSCASSIDFASLESQFSSCGKASLSPIEQQAGKFEDGTAVAGICKDRTQADNGNDGLGTGLTNDTKNRVEDGYSFDEGVGSALMSALGGMMGGMGGQQQGQEQPQEPYYPESCEQNPNLSHCPAKVKESWNPEGGMQLASVTDSTQPSDFNISDPPVELPNEIQPGKAADPAQVSAVPNGGGAVPQGAGNPGVGANNVGAAGAAKARTDILQGERSGGYSQMAADMKMDADGSGGFSGYGSGSNTAASGYRVGMDLKQFLPGGTKDPARKLAGQGFAERADIQSAGVNIWERISDRFRNRCAQGLLRDCVP